MVWDIGMALAFNAKWIVPIVLATLGLVAVNKKWDILGATEQATKQRWIRRTLYILAGIYGVLTLLANFGLNPL